MPSDPCDSFYGSYTSTQPKYTNATSDLQKCIVNNPSTIYANKLSSMDQPIVRPITQRINTATPIIQSIDNQTVTYTALVTSTKALIAATQPLTDYKTILQDQLNATLQQNTSIQQQIATDANSTMTSLAVTPDLSNGGPFGTSNVQQGVLWGFLGFYSLFFILLSIIIYLKFKNSVSSSLLITGILVLLAAAGTGAYFCAAYSLFLFDVQSLVTTTTV